MKAEAMFDALVEKVQALTAASVEDGEEIIALESEVDALTTERDALKAALETGTKLIEDTTAAGKALLAQINEFYRLGYTNAVHHISAQLPESTFKVFEVVFEKYGCGHVGP